jgi:hypothetical protein
VVAQKNSDGLRLFDFAAAGGFLGLTLVSIIGLVFAGLGGLMLLKNTRIPELEDKRTTQACSPGG